ncbi:ankyrin repeat and BTB/POZ domain-containing protein [Purpureocillium lavendulum]|uniref:Ankyrin repeat and BTB/POZ domain-containing protein n=1 Tax=Purpureocillium lavendulum TaxID=1247861 RepID=A0AB34G649_9HYPO|nr:ankyrin repeat and BTB/POZ domain-containing protein [Purpureocillium lavendulum]
MVLRKHELEGKLGEESALIKSGVLRDENPLDQSPEFQQFLLACRHGDLRQCQELIGLGVNINGKDKFDYTPLIIASLCGHYELVQLLLESGALAERNTFQGERCIYNALNDRIRNLLLQYDFSKTSDPYVYWSTHISSLFARTSPHTSDITLVAGERAFNLHKFLLASRSPYFRRKLEEQPETTTWNLVPTIPVEAFQIALRYVYLGDLPRDIVPTGSQVSEEDVAKGLDKVSKQLEVEHLWEAIMAGNDRRLARQRYQDEEERAMRQIGDFFRRHVLGRKMVVDTERVGDIRWDYDNTAFADVLLRADEQYDEEGSTNDADATPTLNGQGIPMGAAAGDKRPRKTALYPVHKAMLIRSEYFEKMFSGDFVESRRSEHLRVVKIDCSPAVLELVLTFLYTENTNCPLEHALDLLYAADMLFLDSLKSKAAVAISTLGSGTRNALVDRTHAHITNGEDGDNNKNHNKPEAAAATAVETTTTPTEMEPINIYDVIHAAWDLRVQRLEEFAARYLATRLEDYIDDLDFQELIRESAARIQRREETDTIELLDDIRYYLSERFRLRFEDTGLDDVMLDDDGTPIAGLADAGEIDPGMAAALADRGAAMAAAAGAADNTKAEGRGPKTEPVQVPSGAGAVLEPELAPERDGEAGATGAEDAVRTLDGATADDEFASDAINYQILLGKIDAMLDRLKLDA